MQRGSVGHLRQRCRSKGARLPWHRWQARHRSRRVGVAPSPADSIRFEKKLNLEIKKIIFLAKNF
jgi:hypothetical protein